MTRAIKRFAITDGRRRRRKPSWRALRQPMTMSYPSRISAISAGMSAGSFCRSASIVITMRPRDEAKPASKAPGWKVTV